MKELLADDRFFQRLHDLDRDLFLELKSKGCPHCRGPLDTSNFTRKPRGLGEAQERRFSLCCRREGCRKRLTPISLRFFGRKVYPAWVVILALDFMTRLGLNRTIARQTLARWRALWLERLAEISPFMKWARGLLPVGLEGGLTPAAVLPAFGFPSQESWVPCLRFFSRASVLGA